MIELLDVVAVMALLGSASAPSCRTADARVEQVIKAKVRELDGHE